MSAQAGDTRPAAHAGRDASVPLAPDIVAGTVLTSTDKRPVPGANLVLQDTRTRRTAATTRTDEAGRYHFQQLPAGKYALSVSAPGYLGHAYQDHDGFSTALVLGAGLDVGNLLLELTPEAAVSGYVTDEAGDPVAHATMTLFREQDRPEPADSDAGEGSGRIRRFRNAQTADDGSYSFDNLPAGRFYLSAVAQPWYAVHPRASANENGNSYRANIDPALDVAYAETFYPGAILQREATPLVLQGGANMLANVTMRPEHAINITFRLPPETTPDGSGGRVGIQRGYSYPQIVRKTFGADQPVNTQIDQDNGPNGRTMTVTGLTPGQYALHMFGPNGSAGSRDEPIVLGNSSISMDLPTTDAALVAGVTVILRMADGSALPANLRLNLRGVRNQFRGGNGAANDKGVVELPKIAAGDYQFLPFAPGRSMYVAAVQVDGHDEKDKRLHITSAEARMAVVTLGTYAPAIDGTAQLDGKPAPGSMIVLVPAGAGAETESFRRDQSDLDGSFTMAGVEPGNYLLIAIQDGWKLRWNDIPTLTPYLAGAVPVTVPSSGPGTIHVAEPLVPQQRH